MLLSIVLNIYQERDLTGVFKIAANSGLMPNEYEIVINFNNPDNPLVNSKFPDNVRKIIQKDNIGNPQGLNCAIEAAKGTYIALISADFILPEGWGIHATNVLKIHEIGLAGFYWAKELYEKGGNPDFFKGHRMSLASGGVVWVPTKVFGCWVVRKSIFSKVGMLCGKLSKYGQWDSEFQQRMKYYNYLAVYIDDCKRIGAGLDAPEYRLFKNEQLRIAATNYEQLLNTIPLTQFGGGNVPV